MTVPRVSVLMAAYNAMRYLPEAVESILSQTFPAFEFVIVDDGSTDGTPGYLASLSDDRIRVVTQANQGLAAALNHGLSLCRGEYIARMDADDRSLPERLARQVAFLDAHHRVGCAGCQTAQFGDSRVGGSLHMPATHQEICQALESGRHALVHPSIMVRAELIRQVGGYWPLRLVSEDHDLFLRLSEVAEMAAVSPVLFHYRVHSGSLNGRNMKQIRRGIDYSLELARCRRAGLPPIEFDDYARRRDGAPPLAQWRESIDAFAKSSYLSGVGDLYGNRSWRGKAKIALAAALKPTLTAQRVLRTVSGWRSRRSAGTCVTPNSGSCVSRNEVTAT